MDAKWWSVYLHPVLASFGGERVSVQKVGRVNQMRGQHFGNSGAAAMALAAQRGARRIVMLGYDCGAHNGMRHWHGDHVPQLGNAKSMPKWEKQFDNLEKHLSRRGVEVVNCSRRTALKCFAVGSLESALG